MPDYAAQWDRVWTPYREHAARNSDQGAITIIAHVNDIKETCRGNQESLPESLRELNNYFFTPLENYKATCRQLKNAPTQDLADDVQAMNTGLREDHRSATALRLCASVSKVIHDDKSAGLIQGDAHKGLVYNVLVAILKISEGLKADRDLYGQKNVGETLRKIRENP
jgi:hypothetical protein